MVRWHSGIFTGGRYARLLTGRYQPAIICQPSAQQSWQAECITAGVKEEMKFLKYRRDVVADWPDSPRKAVFLTGIESRINTMQRQLQMATVAAERLAAANGTNTVFRFGTESA
jgi:hypothetical protein